jgi:calcineurin-like phosphoesterase
LHVLTHHDGIALIEGIVLKISTVDGIVIYFIAAGGALTDIGYCGRDGESVIGPSVDESVATYALQTFWQYHPSDILDALEGALFNLSDPLGDD